MTDSVWLTTPSGKLRARGLGLSFEGTPGPFNAITDVPGLSVGVATLIDSVERHDFTESAIRTGVTVILPRGLDGFGNWYAAGIHSQNGNGELTGSHLIQEIGCSNTPISITNTHAVGSVHRAVLDWIVQRSPTMASQWLLPVVAETWDGYLNDINGDHVRKVHVFRALDEADHAPLEEGSVGGGTGMNCYGFKGGNGTASRQVSFGGTTYTVGVLLQTNFGSRHELSYRGLPVGAALSTPCPIEQSDWLGGTAVPAGSGSCIAVVATDAPLLSDQLRALARRVTMGLARTGTTGSHFSGDVFLALSTANDGAVGSSFPVTSPEATNLSTVAFVPWGYINPFYDAVVQATEEAVWNSLTANDTMMGRDGHTSFALPHDELRQLLGAAH